MSEFADDIPDFATLAADPEIAPLLEFEPVPRKVKRPDGWTPELQRELIARIAATGTVQEAVWQMGKHATGAEALYKTPIAGSFRASWDQAIAIGRRRNGLDSRPPYAGEVPGITRRKSATQHRVDDQASYVPGIPLDLQERDYREALDYERRAQLRWDESHRRVRDKFFYCRRMYLKTIVDDPERRAAWELLCGPADWDAARHLQKQPDEDREPVHLEELQTASWQVPLKTGFCVAITDAGRTLAANTLERLEQSIRQNDPRFASSSLSRSDGEGNHPQDGGGADGANDQ